MNKLQWKQYWREQRLENNKEWKDIPGYEGLYQINKICDIKSLKHKNMKIMKLLKNNHGYLNVGLTKNGEEKIFLAHRLIAITFIPNPENKPHINHINGIKSDNRVENLEWCTASENMKHAWDTGLKIITKNNFIINNPNYWKGKFGKNHSRSKSVFQYKKAGEFIKEHCSIFEASKNTGINRGNISSCCSGKLNSAGGFIWRSSEFT